MSETAPATESSLRQRLQFHVPRGETPPHGVRAWLGAYLRYRGVDDARARRFIWSGADLQRADRAALRAAFRAHCSGCQDWEADLMAADVEAFVRVRDSPAFAHTPPLPTTLALPTYPVGGSCPAFGVCQRLTYMNLVGLPAHRASRQPRAGRLGAQTAAA